MELAAKIIAMTGMALLFFGLSIFTTETASACALSTTLILIGIGITIWITNRWDFDKGEED